MWNFLEKKESIMKEHHVSRWLREYMLQSLSTEMNSQLIENEFNPSTLTQILSRKILKLGKYRISYTRTKGQRKSHRPVGVPSGTLFWIWIYTRPPFLKWREQRATWLRGIWQNFPTRVWLLLYKVILKKDLACRTSFF